MKKEELKSVKKLKKEALKQQFISARQTNLDSFHQEIFLEDIYR